MKRDMTGLEILEYMKKFDNSEEYFKEIATNTRLFDGIEIDSNISKEELDEAFKKSLNNWKIKEVSHGTEK
jgi:hypothetical protein